MRGRSIQKPRGHDTLDHLFPAANKNTAKQREKPNRANALHHGVSSIAEHFANAMAIRFRVFTVRSVTTLAFPDAFLDGSLG